RMELRRWPLASRGATACRSSAMQLRERRASLHHGRGAASVWTFAPLPHHGCEDRSSRGRKCGRRRAAQTPAVARSLTKKNESPRLKSSSDRERWAVEDIELAEVGA